MLDVRRATIADSGALRTRRWQQHKRGDHSLCRNCAARREPVAELAPVESIFTAAAAHLDPKVALRELAMALQAAYAQDPQNANLARELRMTLQTLMGSGGAASDGELADLFDAFAGGA